MLNRRALVKGLAGSVGALAGGAALGGGAAFAQRARVPAVPAAPVPSLTQVLGRPAAQSVALSVLSDAPREAFVEFWSAPGRNDGRTQPVALAAGMPQVLEIGNLKADTTYTYRLNVREPGAADFIPGIEQGFRTARRTGGAFSFTVQGDSHPERINRMYDPTLYAQTMQMVAAERADFHVTIGDDFSLDPPINAGTVSQVAVDTVYRNQRAFLATIGRTSPLFLVNGNHEQIEPFTPDGRPNPNQVLAGNARTRFFALPAPDPFYSGNGNAVQGVGLPRDYYAWEWGDAQFVVFDPYWHSPVPVDQDSGNLPGGGKAPRQRDWWGMSIGDMQYAWLKATLLGSSARYKFVFSHHVLGTGRGGIEMADLYEFGGRSQNRAFDFAKYRPNWEMPIHQLFVKAGVSVFFFGHDHLFARQEKDGVIYQETPMPADPTYTAFNADAYRSGTIFPNSGYLKVRVAPDKARVDYVSSVLPKDQTAQRKNGTLVFGYDVKPRSA